MVGQGAILANVNHCKTPRHFHESKLEDLGIIFSRTTPTYPGQLRQFSYEFVPKLNGGDRNHP